MVGNGLARGRVRSIIEVRTLTSEIVGSLWKRLSTNSQITSSEIPRPAADVTIAHTVSLKQPSQASLKQSSQGLKQPSHASPSTMVAARFQPP